MNSIAASATGALKLTRVPFFASAGMAAGAHGQLKSAMWQGPCRFQYRPHGLVELGSACGRCHLSLPGLCLWQLAGTLSRGSGDADRSVYQLMAQDRGHLHRQQAFRLAQVGPDEDLKMP